MQLILKSFNSIIQNILIFACHFITDISVSSKTDLTINKTRIYYANHSSHADTIMIYTCLPKSIRNNVTPVAAIDYWNKNKISLYFAKNIFNATLIDRFYNKGHTAAKHPIEAIVQQLNQGKSILVFPEGTRSLDGNINNFKSGLYHISKLVPDAEIIPVFLKNVNRVLPKGGHLPVPIMCRAIFDIPLAPVNDNETKGEFLTRAKKRLEELKHEFTG